MIYILVSTLVSFVMLFAASRIVTISTNNTILGVAALSGAVMSSFGFSTIAGAVMVIIVAQGKATELVNAFLTVIGSSLLNIIIVYPYFFQPAQI